MHFAEQVALAKHVVLSAIQANSGRASFIRFRRLVNGEKRTVNGSTPFPVLASYHLLFIA
jgi:hypothetical protein